MSNKSGYAREYNLRTKYGITVFEFDDMLAKQNYSCGACQSPVPGPKGWHVDHDHQTGRVRGILCGKCNMGLGLLGDTVEALRAALAYLENAPFKPARIVVDDCQTCGAPVVNRPDTRAHDWFCNAECATKYDRARWGTNTGGCRQTL